MDESTHRTTDASPPDSDADQLRDLRERLEQAQIGERQAQALLESMAALMGLSDTDEVFAGIAENAARHVGLPSVAIYRADHQAGTLSRVALAVIDSEAPHRPPPGMAVVRMIDVQPDPIPLGPGNMLAEFAVGDEPYRVTSLADEVTGEERSGVLVQMRCGSADSSPHGALIGIIVATSTEPATARQVNLLRALSAIGAAAAEAARVEVFRTQLVSSVSHELRTPLAAIRAYNELLLDGDAGPINDEQRLFLQRIETTCMHLDRMVEDLLDLSRMRVGELVITKSPTDVVAVIEHIFDTLAPEAARRNVSLIEDIREELPLISSNADRLAQVLFNLVGNAVKYVGDGGRVTVSAEVRDLDARAATLTAGDRDDCSPADGDCLVIEVSDNGPGIAAEDMGRIFDEFYRGRLTVGTTKGSGLGLSIALQLTRLLGGALDATSTPGEGSTFSLVFPIPADHDTCG